jgi:heme A synthase
MRMKRLLSSLLMATGIVLVFYGINAALGFTVIGMFASLAAITSLLYAGAVLFGAATDSSRESAMTEDSADGERRRAIDIHLS